MEPRFFFFAGGDYHEDEGNAFTSHFIRLSQEILGDRFSVIRGIYRSRILFNVIWGLHHAQEPMKNPMQSRTVRHSVEQILACPLTPDSTLTLVSSSYGSVVAAQVACLLGELAKKGQAGLKPFHVALGASLVDQGSELYKKLEDYRNQGFIGKILLSELHDEGDNTNSIGGLSRREAYLNGLGVCFPFLTRKFEGPSFLNKHPVHGHLHRVRAQSIQKSYDFIKTILIDHELGGIGIKAKALQAIPQGGSQTVQKPVSCG